MTTTENGVYTAKQLYDKIIPPMRWIAKDFLGEGITMLSARPKAGKSLLALQLGIAVVTGEPFLGRYQTVKGAVLYVNVDDPSQGRLQANLHLLGGRVDGLTFMSVLPELDNGGLEILDKKLSRMAEIDPCRLLILDTLTALRREQSGKNLVKADYEFIAGIKGLVSKHGCSVLLISHTRKDSTNSERVDGIDSHLGTTGLTAAVDAVMMLTGADDTRKVLKAKGRDISPFEVHMELQVEDRSGWLVVDAPAEKKKELSALRQRILDAVLAIGPCGPDAVSKETGINLNTVRSDMRRMAAAGQLFKDSNACYSAEEHTPSILVALPALSALPASPADATNALMHLMHPTQPALPEPAGKVDEKCHTETPKTGKTPVTPPTQPVSPVAAQKEARVNPTMSKNIVNLKGQEFNLETQSAEFLVKAFNIAPYQAEFVLAGVGVDYMDKVVSSLRESWKLIKKTPDKPAFMRGLVEEVAPVLDTKSEPGDSPFDSEKALVAYVATERASRGNGDMKQETAEPVEDPAIAAAVARAAVEEILKTMPREPETWKRIVWCISQGITNMRVMADAIVVDVGTIERNHRLAVTKGALIWRMEGSTTIYSISPRWCVATMKPSTASMASARPASPVIDQNDNRSDQWLN